MAEVNTEIKKLIEQYLKLLAEKGFHISEAYLYGSYANGKPDKWSDIDLAIISEEFEGNRYLDTMKILSLYREIDLRLSVLPLNKDAKNNFFISKEIIKKGIRVY